MRTLWSLGGDTARLQHRPAGCLVAARPNTDLDIPDDVTVTALVQP
jgi:hypothetical protein